VQTQNTKAPTGKAEKLVHSVKKKVPKGRKMLEGKEDLSKPRTAGHELETVKI